MVSESTVLLEVTRLDHPPTVLNLAVLFSFVLDLNTTSLNGFWHLAVLFHFVSDLNKNTTLLGGSFLWPSDLEPSTP